MRSFLYGAFGVLVMAGLLFVGLHLYIDHANLHALVEAVQRATPAEKPSK